MTGEKERDATKVSSWTWTGDVVAHGCMVLGCTHTRPRSMPCLIMFDLKSLVHLTTVTEHGMLIHALGPLEEVGSGTVRLDSVKRYTSRVKASHA